MFQIDESPTKIKKKSKWADPAAEELLIVKCNHNQFSIQISQKKVGGRNEITDQRHVAVAYKVTRCL